MYEYLKEFSMKKEKKTKIFKLTNVTFLFSLIGLFFTLTLIFMCTTPMIQRGGDYPESIPVIPCRSSYCGTGEFSEKISTTYLKGCFNTEEYARIYENPFLNPISHPLSTFSIDVDTASYTNVRRFLHKGKFPPEDAIRVEELINYFNYKYPQPTDNHPFSIVVETAECPWRFSHKLVHIGLQGKNMQKSVLPANNLVFLIDVSGSMDDPNKLPLVKSTFKLLVNQLRKEDRVAIVVYAGAAGLVLQSTPGDQKEKILTALDSLKAGGSTAGGAGIKLAYKVALDNFIKHGNNRLILATDGDFNIGISSTSELVRMIEEKRNHGVFLTVLGFGSGNLKDHRMESLADKGNGNYLYIDNILEAKKAFVDELQSTLFTVAKDVKIQVEFNPAKVKEYKLIGYENRLMDKKDFKDDPKDAGDMGAGHSVTALYEIVPTGSEENNAGGDDELRYQKSQIKPEAFKCKEILTLKVRYKEPGSEKSKLVIRPEIEDYVSLRESSENFRFSAAVAEFGLRLRDVSLRDVPTYKRIIQMAKTAKGKDDYGYRAEFIRLVETCQAMTEKEHLKVIKPALL
jgi:Ca-activated chloride channel family protein